MCRKVARRHARRAVHRAVAVALDLGTRAKEAEQGSHESCAVCVRRPTPLGAQNYKRFTTPGSSAPKGGLLCGPIKLFTLGAIRSHCVPSMSEADCALPPSLRAGLAADLAAFPLRSISRQVFVEARRSDRRLRECDITAMFGIYNNTLYWLEPDAHPLPRNPQLYAIADDLRALLGLYRVPDVEFRLNVDDYPKSQFKVLGVPVPLFSFTKRERRDPSTGRMRTSDYDVLVPSGAFRMSFLDAKLESRTVAGWERAYPWDGKTAK